MVRAASARAALRSSCAAALLSVLLVASAAASAGGETVETVLHVPALLVEDQCNGGPVVLNGDLRITTTTTPLPNGGYTVRATARSEGLSGVGAAGEPYDARDDEFSFAYYAPPPRASSFVNVHLTKLTPRGGGPTMYLVTVLRVRTSADGTATPTLNRSYLVCAPRR